MHAAIRRSTVTALFLILTTAGGLINAQEADEEWEYQGSMEMSGMIMPVPPTRRCEPPMQEQVTPPVDGNCEVKQMETDGPKTSFTIVCSDPTPMEGSGVTIRTPDTFESNYLLKSDEGEISFNMKGMKVGACKL